MKALPLWQPWASLVVVGAKCVETRHWCCPPHLIGQRIAIHATKTKTHLGLVGRSPFAERLLAALEAGTLVEEAGGGLPLGALIGTVVVDHSSRMSEEYCAWLATRDPEEFAFGHYEPGRFAWVLRDVVRLPEPIPFTGRQGIFDVPDELLGLAPAQGKLI